MGVRETKEVRDRRAPGLGSLLAFSPSLLAMFLLRPFIFVASVHFFILAENEP